ncbi:MAG: chaperonin GroEL [Firmicutes bacterium]|nr:chaperonin GroEL [Bacillota bacterium]
MNEVTKEKVLTGNEAREKIFKGANTLCDVVKSTLGPKGSNVVLGTELNPIITNDGVTIANSVSLSDPIENLGATIVKQASQMTNAQAGDGTTSVIVLANEIINLARDEKNPVLLKDELIDAARVATQFADKLAKKCDTLAELAEVITNSCASKTDGEMIAKAIDSVGPDGTVIIEENTHGQTTLTFSDGLECGLVLASPYFATDATKLESVITSSKVLIASDPINSIKDLIPTLEYIKDKGDALFIIAPEFTPDVLGGLLLNRARAGVDVTAVRSEVINYAALSGDIAAITGATVIGRESDTTIKDLLPIHLGVCEKIVSGMKSTKFIASVDDEVKLRVKKRADQIRGQIENTKDEYLVDTLKKRLASLSGGVATISVGCATAIETKERKLRIDDGLMAGLSARKGGVVTGGGYTYIRIASEVSKIETAGAMILAKALCSIQRQICENAEVDPGGVFKKLSEKAVCYDAREDKFVPVSKSKIVDPTMVIKSVITNAVSVAATLLTTRAVCM